MCFTSSRRWSKACRSTKRFSTSRTARRRSEPAAAIADEIKQRILERTGLTASVGVAPNKLVAKIASDLRKPDGLVVVTPHEVTALLDPLSIRRLFGIGNKTAPQLEQHRHSYAAGSAPGARGRAAAGLRPLRRANQGARRRHRRAAGHRRLGREADQRRGDVRHRSRDRAQHARRSSRNSPTAWRCDCARSGWLAGRVVVKIRRKDFRTYTRQCAGPTATRRRARSHSPRREAARRMAATSNRDAAVRLLGVGAGELPRAPQLDLFAVPASQSNQHLDAALDDIRAKFGNCVRSRGPARCRRAAPRDS